GEGKRKKGRAGDAAVEKSLEVKVRGERGGIFVAQESNRRTARPGPRSGLSGLHITAGRGQRYRDTDDPRSAHAPLAPSLGAEGRERQRRSGGEGNCLVIFPSWAAFNSYLIFLNLY